MTHDELIGRLTPRSDDMVGEVLMDGNSIAVELEIFDIRDTGHRQALVERTCEVVRLIEGGELLNEATLRSRLGEHEQAGPIRRMVVSDDGSLNIEYELSRVLPLQEAYPGCVGFRLNAKLVLREKVVGLVGPHFLVRSRLLER